MNTLVAVAVVTVVIVALLIILSPDKNLKKDVFLICPVRNATDETSVKIAEYVANLERADKKVHWPARDTKQDDPTGGYEICRTNSQALLDASEVHIWYDETSAGSKFDMGGLFMLVEMLGWEKKIVIANSEEVVDNSKKSFYKVFLRLIENQDKRFPLYHRYPF